MTATLETPRIEVPELGHKLYVPHGAALELMKSRDPELLICGPAGSGKSIAALNKIYLLCSSFPGTRYLIVRKTRASLTESAMVTFENDVLPEGSRIAEGASRGHRRNYRFPNGSEIVLAGMDKPSRVMSSEWDGVFCQEAIELAEPEWEALVARNRNFKAKPALPFRQIIADTNPDRPTHWLKQRCDRGQTKLLFSRHEDNPTLWDGKNWTAAGIEYIARLDKLTGPRRDRLRFGRWVQAEGLVYDMWDPGLHLIARGSIELKPEWPRYLAIDFGYTAPFVCQWWAQDDDDRLYLYKEIYFSQRLVEDHAEDIKRYSEGEPRPRAIICDHDAEGRATLEKYLGVKTTPAWKEDKQAGIQAVASRLRRAGDGKPRLYIFRDGVFVRDAKLKEHGKPQTTADELDGYCWDTAGGRNKGEEPVKENDHGADAMRYVVSFLDCKPRKRFWAA